MIFINQVREKIGIVFGNPEVTPGGRALKFQASVRIELRKQADIKPKGQEDYSTGTSVKAKVVKNKMAPPFRIATYDIIYGKGISKTGCILDLALEHGLVRQKGTWFSYGEESVAQGRDNMVEWLTENSDVVEKITEEITSG